jgi:uncharacterized protein (TIGR02001 family)
MGTMKKTMGLAMLAGAATFASAGAANAEVTANVALTTDYVFRGISQTDNGAAIQGGFDWTGDLFYAGVWGSNVNFGAVSPTETASMELDAYVGIRPETGPVSWDIGLVGYFYPNGDDSVAGGEMDYFEIIAGAEVEVADPFSIGGQLAYSPEFFGETGDALYAEINGKYEFSDAFNVSAAYGNQDVDDTGDYDTWNIGVAYAMHGFTFDLRYHDTDIDDLDEIVNFTISREL